MAMMFSLSLLRVLYKLQQIGHLFYRYPFQDVRRHGEHVGDVHVLIVFAANDILLALFVPGVTYPTDLRAQLSRFHVLRPHTSTAWIPVLHRSVDRRCRHFYPIRGPKGHTITLPEWRCGRGGFALGYIQPQIDSVMAKAR